MSLSRTVYEINGDFTRKSPIFPTPMYFTIPLNGFPWNLALKQGIRETRMMGLPGVQNSFKIGLTI